MTVAAANTVRHKPPGAGRNWSCGRPSIVAALVRLVTRSARNGGVLLVAAMQGN
jgi:hypothetical protein